MPPTSPGFAFLPPLHASFFNITCPINVLSPLYYLHFENRLHHCVLRGEMNKIRPHLYIFLRCFALLATYVITSSLSRSNLCVYRIIIVTTYVYDPLYFDNILGANQPLRANRANFNLDCRINI